MSEARIVIPMAANLVPPGGIMGISSNKTVRELAVEVPNATRVFENFGIDYCCGGKRPLDEACAAANLPVDEVIKALSAAAKPSAPAGHLQSGSLAELIEH